MRKFGLPVFISIPFLVIAMMAACMPNIPEIPEIPEIPDIVPPQVPWQTPSPGETVKPGLPARATFWVSVPYNTPQQDTILLSIDGQQPIAMKAVGELSWEVEVEVKGGDVVSYEYLRGSENSVSSQYQVTISAEDQKVFDGVAGWSDLPFNPQFSDDFTISMYMFDTWGRNYNFNMFEDTRRNINGSFARVAGTGVEEVYVNDFFMAVYGEGHRMGSTDYTIEPEIFENDMRDEAMTQDDLGSLTQEASAQDLKTGWRSSMHFVDIGKYMGLPNITAEVAKDWEEFDKPKTEEWVESYLSRWKQVMLERAEMLNKAGFDLMIVTPGYMNPKYYPYEELANEMWRDIINSVKAVFNGQVGVVVDRYGFLEGVNGQEDWSKYDYYREADAVYYFIYRLLDIYQTPENPSFDQMKDKLGAYLDDLEVRARDKGVKLSIVPVFNSYENALNKGVVEFNDIANPAVQALNPDWQHQADAYEALFQAAEGRTEIVRLVPFGYWWDDAMDPATARPRISVSPSQRNKQAEGVIKKWAFSLK